MDRFTARQLAGFDRRGGELRDAARELGPVQITKTDHVAGVEVAFALLDTWGQQTLSTLAQSLLCTVIHEQRAFGMMKEGDPTFTARQFLRVRNKQRALFRAAQNVGQ